MPIQIKAVFGQAGVKDQPCTFWLGLHQELYLGVVAKRFEMSDTDRFFGDPFLIEDLSGSELTDNTETLRDHTSDQIDLNLPHQPCLNLPQLLVPAQMQRGLFLLENL